MISPFKAVIGDNYKAVEARLLAAIHIRFGLPAAPSAELLALIKAADQRAPPISRRRGSPGFAAAEARRFFGTPPALSAAIAARLSHALAGGNRRGALSRTLCTTVSRLTLSRHASAAHIYGAMIHVCSLARLHRTVEETGARHVVTLLRDVHLVHAPRSASPRTSTSSSAWTTSPSRSTATSRPARSTSRKLIAFARGWDRADADGRALLCRHQPLDRRRLRRRLRAQSRAATELQIAQELRRRSAHRLAQPPHRVDRRRRCSAATAAWSTRSSAIGRGERPTRQSRSGWSWNSALSPAPAR